MIVTLTDADSRIKVRLQLPLYWRLLGRPWVEAYSVFVSLGWTVLLFTTPLFGRSVSFDAMKALASQNVWGCLIGLSACVQLAALLLRWPGLRFLAVAMGASQWTFIAIMISQALGVGTGAVVYGGLGLFLLLRSLERED